MTRPWKKPRPIHSPPRAEIWQIRPRARRDPAISDSPDPRARTLSSHWRTRDLPWRQPHDPTTGQRYSQTRQGSNLHHAHNYIGRGMTPSVLPTHITVRTTETCAGMQASIQVTVPTTSSKFKALLPNQRASGLSDDQGKWGWHIFYRVGHTD